MYFTGVPDDLPDPVALEAIKTRTICHVLVAALPDEGLREAAESLLENLKYYRAITQTEAPAIAAPVREFDAEYGPSFVRPPLHIEEE